MFERFTVETRGIVIGARQLATELKHPFIGTEHLLLAMLSPDAGLASRVLTQAGLTAPGVRAEIQRHVGSGSPILDDGDAAALQTIGIDLDAVLSRIEESFGPEALLPPPPEPRRGLLRRKSGRGSRFSNRAKKVLELSLREAVRLKDNHIGSEHVLLGLIREGDGLAAKIITEAGISLEDLRRATLAAMPGDVA